MCIRDRVNTITLSSLSDGTYSDCAITVTDKAANESNLLTLTSFLVDSTASTLVETTAIASSTNDSTPDYTFVSSEAGTITYSGSCSASTTSVIAGTNTITFNSLSEGTYSDCKITITDSLGNAVTLNIGSFVIDTSSPTVSSISPTDNQSAVAISENISVTFSDAMDKTSITTNTDNTSCYGTLMVSSDNFSNCVQMASPNKALDFDGTNDYVDVGDFSLGGSLTFEAWMQYDSRATWSRIFDFGENGAGDDNIWLGLAGSSGTLRFEILLGSSFSKVTDGDGVQTAFGQVPIDGTWIHVAATISGTAGTTNGTGKLYVNGNLVGTKTNMYVPAMMTRNKQYLGKSNWNGDSYLDAKMDEFRIWNYVRTQSEIQSTMNNTLTGLSLIHI